MIRKHLKSYLYIYFIFITIIANSQKFKVVLDAGHGGKDFGASYHGHAEKNIALAVVLKVGKLLEKNPNIDVIYTRKTDVFVELDERANIANREKATIFMSIHCNANKNTVASGFETYVMGTARTKSNLEVAKLENDVISLEKDYKENYEGYNPNSPESEIGMMMLQEEYRESSVALAAKIQENFAENSDRKNRDVREAGFLVLRKIAMPRVLIEMGFISNTSEGQYLASEEGQMDIARDIAAAVVSYKREYYGADKSDPTIEKSKFKIVPKVVEITKIIKKDTIPKPIVIKSEQLDSIKKEVIFKVQLSAIATNLSLIPSNFNGLENVTMEQIDNYFKYYYGDTSKYSEAQTNLKIAKLAGYKTAFLIAFKDDKKIDIIQAIKLSKN